MFLKLRKIVFIFGLGLAAITGQYVRADEIEALMAEMNHSKIEFVLQKEQDEGEGIPDALHPEQHLPAS